MSNVGQKNVWQMDKDHFIHPYTDFSTFGQEGSQVISRASGVHVIDNEGSRYIDAIAGLWCVNVGHGRAEIADAVRQQILDMQFFNPFGHSTNEPAAIFAEKLAQLSPGDLNHVFYSTGGSTANDIAVRFAHYYHAQNGEPLRTKIISRLDGYHGSTYLAASLTGIHATKIGFNRIAEDVISHVSAANLYRRPEGMNESEYCDYLVQEFRARIEQLGPDNVAAFIAEPIMGAGGVLVAPSGYHRRMWEVCQEHGILYIADEVVTAFGRLGHWFASEAEFDYVPDILVSAKGITSGYIPLGATLVSDKVYEALSRPQVEGGALTLGFTYSGHAVACAAALKNVEIMERESLCQQVQVIGPYFEKKLQELTELELVGDVRGRQLMAGIELVSNKATKEPLDPAATSAHRVFERARARGVIVRPIGNIVVLSPPLILTQEHVDEIGDALQESIVEVTQELKAAGYLNA